MADRCIDCARFRLKEAKDMAAHGFGLCAKKPGPFVSAVFSRHCPDFSQADEKTQQARNAWYAARRGGAGIVSGGKRV